MSGKTFLDTNIVVYLYSGDEPEKRAAALALIEQNNSINNDHALKLCCTKARHSLTQLYCASYA